MLYPLSYEGGTVSNLAATNGRPRSGDRARTALLTRTTHCNAGRGQATRLTGDDPRLRAPDQGDVSSLGSCRPVSSSPMP